MDYLLKPVKIDELKNAVEKVRSVSQQVPDYINLTALLNNIRACSKVLPSLVIHNLKGFEVLKLPEIIMCQADGYCTNFYLTGNRKVVSSKNLKYFNELLEDHNFIQIHHSYMISLDHVTGYNKQVEILLSEEQKAYLDDSYRNDVIKRFARK